MIVGGQFLDGDQLQAHISGGGVKAKVVKCYRPMTQGEVNALRNEARTTPVRNCWRSRQRRAAGRAAFHPEAAAKEAGVTEEQLKELEIYRKRDADPKRQPNPQIVEEVTLQVDVAADASRRRSRAAR